MRWLLHALAVLGCRGLILHDRSELEDADDFGLHASAWLGHDDNASTGHGVGERGRAGAAPAGNGSAWAHPPILVLGLFNAGTNLLTQLLLKNFPDLADRGVWGKDISGSGLVWKHSKPEHLKQKLRQMGKPNLFRDQGVVGVAVIRDPLSWLQSMKKAPYYLNGCVGWADWPTHSCTFPAPSGEWPYSLCHSRAFHVSNIESAWNDWNSQYHGLDTYAGFAPGKFLVVSYEDLVVDPKRALDRIAAVSGRAPPAVVNLQDAPAKSHGRPSGRLEALRKLQEKSYLRLYVPSERTQACDRLNHQLMQRHGYLDCGGWR